jgi:hypothetical protein
MRLLPAIAAAVVLAWAAPAADAAMVPHDFFGTFVDGPMLADTGKVDSEFDAMVDASVGSVRLLFDWRTAQRYKTFDDVPESQRQYFRDERGVPTDWREIDGWVRVASARHLKLLPVVMIAPRWAALTAGNDASPPANNEDYARFLHSLVDRYGPEGAFWNENPELPKLPIRDWQIWNEPHFTEFWADQPFERRYVPLLRAARIELRRADPGARIVLAGLANKSWEYLDTIYRSKARRYFDVVALHPFTRTVDGVIEIIKRNRKVMSRHGDGKKPLFVTELSWTSAYKRTKWTYGNETTETGQAAKVRKALPALARARKKLRIASVYWFEWLSMDRNKTYPFDYAGLSRFENGDVVRKPAFDGFRTTALGLVGCQRKVQFADQCAP